MHFDRLLHLVLMLLPACGVPYYLVLPNFSPAEQALGHFLTFYSASWLSLMHRKELPKNAQGMANSLKTTILREDIDGTS